MMPGNMDGLQFAQLISRTRPGLPVLLASGSNKRVEEAQAYFTTLQKPYDLGDLDRAIQNLIGIRRAQAKAQNLVDLQDAKRLRAAKTEKP
jgi:DNA-binding NtrC family response regulator